MSVMIERLEGMVNRYHEINEMMMSPEIVTDSRMLVKLGREQVESDSGGGNLYGI